MYMFFVVLTNEYVAHQRCGQTEYNHKYVSNGQIYDEKIRHRPHSRRPQHDGDDKTISDQTHRKHQHIRHTIDGRQCGGVAIKHFKVRYVQGICCVLGQVGERQLQAEKTNAKHEDKVST